MAWWAGAAGNCWASVDPINLVDIAVFQTQSVFLFPDPDQNRLDILSPQVEIKRGKETHFNTQKN